ncbi:MAG: FKBP-type peptidyl-prolyl cis-trans isomerase [Deltaproteobacteria bacterium]|nr:FKBP-type peptidyl-prolyl cis-trans isomerase [Deltaproteobacteria bacterium]
MDIATKLKKQLADVDPDVLARAMKDVFAGDRLLLSQEEVTSVLAAYQQVLNKKQADARKQLGERNEAEGKRFLEANRGKEGVVTLESGLQYKVLRQGEGPKPTLGQLVEVHYRGTHLDGTEFDNTYEKQESVQLPVGTMIKGWTEALLLMPVGSKWQLFVPAGLAYGENGLGTRIGPGATLLFELELLAVKDKSKRSKASRRSSPGHPGDADP